MSDVDSRRKLVRNWLMLFTGLVTTVLVVTGNIELTLTTFVDVIENIPPVESMSMLQQVVAGGIIGGLGGASLNKGYSKLKG